MRELKTLDIGCIVRLPKGLPIGILVVFKVGVSNMKVFENVLRLVIESGLPVVRYLSLLSDLREYSYNYIVVDAAGREERVKILVENIKKIEYVKKVEVYHPLKDGMLTASPFDILAVSGIRSMVWVKPTFRAFIKTFQEVIGSGGAAIIYNIGLIMGKGAFQYHMKIAGGDKREALSVNRDFFKACGLGDIEYKVINLDKAVIRVYNSFECEVFKNLGRTASHFIRGIIAGWLSAFWEKDVEINETKCIAKGDPYCEFTAKVVKHANFKPNG